MIYKKAYRYYTGEMVYTFDNINWFILDNYDRVKQIKEPDMDRVVFVIK